MLPVFPERLAYEYASDMHDRGGREKSEGELTCTISRRQLEQMNVSVDSPEARDHSEDGGSTSLQLRRQNPAAKNQTGERDDRFGKTKLDA
jgi:hypothetical protein